MISDRELSELVAEKVMGWSRPGADMAWSDSDGYRKGLNPSFATDAGLALEAAMKVSGKSNIVIGPAYGGGWFAKWRNLIPIPGRSLKRKRSDVGATSTTIARALCLAALRAAGVEVVDDAEKGEGR